MLEETGKVISIESNSLWVETIKQSTCGSCRARKGCGQQLLSKIGNGSANINAIVDINDTNSYSVGDSVTIGIPENIVVLSSLLIYCFPLLLMIVFSGIAHIYLYDDIYVAVLGFLGLFLGGGLIRYYGQKMRSNLDYQPVVLDKQSQVLQVPLA
jgi:sigma-E factor negative regulatory protein RseC